MSSYLEYANTDRQKQIAKLMDENWSSRWIAREVGSDPGNVRRVMRVIKSRATKRGDDEEYEITRPVPDGYKLKGISDMRTNPEGKPVWYKFDEDKERQAEIMRQTVEALKEDITPAARQYSPITATEPDLANVHILTDYHMGMLAWWEETGDDWDTDIAEDLLTRWMAAAIEQAPDAAVGVLAQLGDLLHYDSLESVTPTSGHQLDADSRYAYVVRVVIRSLRRVISMMLDKYPRVHLIFSDANHDPTGGIWLREMFAQYYSEEPRIVVDQSPSTYNCFEWGLTSVFFHHGHKRKMDNIADVFAAQFREVFGRTRYSYGHIGHLHHIAAKETNLMVVEQHRTMAAKDAYAANGGYLSGRSADVITYSREHGQVARQTMTPEMVGLKEKP